MRKKINIFEGIIDNYLYDNDLKKTLNDLMKHDLLEFQEYLQNRCDAIDASYKEVKIKNPAAIAMIEDKRELLHHLLENFENKNNLKPIDDMVKHIFTKLRVKLLSGDFSSDNDIYKVNLNLDNELVEKFKFSMKNRILCQIIFPVRVSYEDDKISFYADEKYFRSENKFSNFLTKKISENKLSWVNDNIISDLLPFIKNKIIEKDIKKYNLDYMYSNSISPTVSVSKNSAILDKNSKIELPDQNHWALKAILSLEKINENDKKKTFKI